MVDARVHLDQFMKVYSSLPLSERELPVVVIDNEPIGWNMACREIKNNTLLGDKIVKKLIELKII